MLLSYATYLGFQYMKYILLLKLAGTEIQTVISRMHQSPHVHQRDKNSYNILYPSRP